MDTINLIHSKTPKPSILKILLSPLPDLVVDNILSYVYSDVTIYRCGIYEKQHEEERKRNKKRRKSFKVKKGEQERAVEVLTTECSKYVSKLNIKPLILTGEQKSAIAKTRFMNLKSFTVDEAFSGDYITIIEFLKEFLPNYTEINYFNIDRTVDVLKYKNTIFECATTFNIFGYYGHFYDITSNLNAFMKMTTNVKQLVSIGICDDRWEHDFFYCNDLCVKIQYMLENNRCPSYEVCYSSYNTYGINLIIDEFNKCMNHDNHVLKRVDNKICISKK